MQKALGILGGMGSLATANFMAQVVSHTQADKDSDHLRIYVDCHPQIPGRVEAIFEEGEDPVSAICESIKKLESIGAQVIAMPCVTAHAFYDKFVESSAVPFLHLPEIAVNACAHDFPGETAGVLSTAAAAKLRILLNQMDRYNVPYITPKEDEQAVLTKLIAEVKANNDITQMAKDFSKTLDSMKKRGADYFVLGCTELPLIAKYCRQEKYRFVDTAFELAKASILACGGLVKL